MARQGRKFRGWAMLEADRLAECRYHRWVRFTDVDDQVHEYCMRCGRLREFGR